LQLTSNLIKKLLVAILKHLPGIFSPQDFGKMTKTHGIGNFSNVLLKIGKKCMSEILQQTITV
jgi:hypothetical protein